MAEDLTPLITARALQIGYHKRAILPPVDLEVRAGECWALIGRNGYDLCHPDDVERIAASHARLFEGPQTVEYRLRTAGGAWRWVETRCQALIVGSALSRIVIVTRDVHQRRLSQDALERKNADLQHFALVAAHDLHEPLRIVASFTGLLGKRYRDALDARGRSYLGFIEDHVARMRGLIDGLLALTRVEVDRTRFTPVPLDAVLADAESELGSALAAADVTLDVGPLPTISGNRAQLTQLFAELLANAVKFREPGAASRIEVRAEPAGAD